MSLEHPNVVPIYDAGEVDGRLYLAMRHVEGTDLRALLRDAEGALEPARALAIGGQVADALDAAHARGLVHRDVKPSNVLLDDRRARLPRRLRPDTAARRRAGRPAGDGRSLGTPAYLAPEQIEGGPSTAARTSTRSAACSTSASPARPPFARDSRLAVAWAHLEEEPPSASEREPSAPDGARRRCSARRWPRSPLTAKRPAPSSWPRPRRRWGYGGRRPPTPQSRTRRRRPTGSSQRSLRLPLAQRGGNSAGSQPSLWARDTLVRVDPRTNAVTQVIDVGEDPGAIAVGGDSVWVYKQRGQHALGDRPRHASAFEHTTRVSTVPLDLGPLTGPVLAADAGGAWFVGFDLAKWKLCADEDPGGRPRQTHARLPEPQAPSWSLMALPGFSCMAVEATRCYGSTWRPARYADACDCRLTPPRPWSMVWRLAGASSGRRSPRRRSCIGSTSFPGRPLPRPGLVGDLARLRLRVGLALRRHPGQTHAACEPSHASQQPRPQRASGRERSVRRRPRLLVATRPSKRDRDALRCSHGRSRRNHPCHPRRAQTTGV